MDLQLTWFVLLAVLVTGYVVLDGFDLGVGILYPFLPRGDEERTALRHSIGPFWDGNEVWLLTAAGALFAAFPPVYATVFSGFYLPLIAAVLGLIFRAVSIEYRSRDPKWGRMWDLAFFGGSLVPPVVFGVAAGNLVRGLPLDATGDSTASLGFLFNPFALLVGGLTVSLFVTHGASWLVLRTQGTLRERARRTASAAHWVTAAAIVAATAGAAIAAPEHVGHVLAHWPGWVAVGGVIAGLVAARVGMHRGRAGWSFAGSAVTLASLVAVWAAGSFPVMVPGWARSPSLSARDSSSSHLALSTMLVIAAIGVPVVLAYTALIYRTFTRSRVGGATEDSAY